MQKLEIMRKARTLIANRTHKHICYALDDVQETYQGTTAEGEVQQAARALTHYVRAQIFPCEDYESWLFNHYPVHYRHMRTEHFLEARLQWMDWMIACLEEDARKKW